MKISENIRVLLFPVGKYDRRKDVEFIENNGYFKDELLHILEQKIDVFSYTLSDFMDLCNNEEFNIDAYFITYVRIIDEAEKHNQAISTVIDSCKEGRDGDWDVANNLDGFNDMITLLESTFIE